MNASPQTELVLKAQRGDVASFEKLFEQYQRGVYNLVFHLVRNDQEAADLTQEVFIRAYRSLGRLQSPEAFSTWLYRIASNLGRNWIRDHTRIRVESLDQSPDGEEEGQRDVADTTGDPAQLFQTETTREMVRVAIMDLSPDHRMVVTMHYLQGMSVEDIGRVMDCSTGTVKSRLSRARDVLRRKLSRLCDA